MGSPFLSFFRLFAVLCCGLVLAPIESVLRFVRAPIAGRLPMYFHRFVCRFLGIHIHVAGKIPRKKPVLFVSNHSSYVDIFVLGSLLKASFVAKSEISGWPIFGHLARLQDTLFIARDRSQVKGHTNEITERLEQKKSLIVFPEGTSNDGNRVLPFKSSLFSVVEGSKIPVQPVTVSYVSLNGMSIGWRLRSLVAWYGDMDMMPHFWQLAGLGRIDVYVELHAPISPEDFKSRKTMSAHCFNVIEEGMNKSLFTKDPKHFNKFKELGDIKGKIGKKIKKKKPKKK
ncbi:MAG: lysophospholipid acyltransferase family protein [Alphaproteobacteria bacterium]